MRERRGRLARRGQVQIVAWSAVTGLTLTDRQGTAGLLAVFETMRPADVASALAELPEKRRHEVVDALDDERLADVFEELSEADQRALLAHLDADRAADVLEAMDPDDAADLLRELPADDADRLLALMEPDESAPVRRLLHYADDTAGGLMTPEPIMLRPDATVAEALARIRNPDIPPALASMVFVCRPPSATPTGRYLGCVHAQRLLREAPFELVAGVVDTELATLSPDTTMLGEVTRYFAAYNLVAGPVVDSEDHLLGAVTVDDVLDHLLPPDWRDRLTEPDNATRGARRGCLRSRRGGGWTSRWSRRQAGSSSTRTRSPGSPSGSPGSWAPAGSSPSRPCIVIVWIALNLFAVACAGTRTRSSCSTWRSPRRPRTPRR